MPRHVAETGTHYINIDGYFHLAGDLSIADGYMSFARVTDPSSSSLDGYLYVKNNDGYSELFYMDNYGMITQITREGLVNGITLDNAYNEGSTILIDDGPIYLNANGDNALDIDGYIALRETITPSALGSSGILYTKDDDGYSELFYLDNYGNEIQVTREGLINGITLDNAYNEGSTILIDSGPIYLNANGDNALDIDGYIALRETITPNVLGSSGILYTKDDDGYFELYYLDNYGNEIQVTNQGYIVNAEPNHGEMYLYDGYTSTTLSSGGAFTKILGSYQDDGYLANFTHSSGTLTYIGEYAQNFAITIQASFTATVTATYLFIVAVNSNTVTKTESRIYSGTDVSNVGVTGLLSLSQNDEIEVHAARSASDVSGDITVQNLTVAIHGIN